jgi:hypothetical protein
MGPLFTAAFLLVVMGAGAVVAFAGFKIFLPFTPAFLASLLLVGFGTVGTLLGLLLQRPLVGLPAQLESSEAVASYLAISLGCGLLLGSAAVALYLARRQRRA